MKVKISEQNQPLFTSAILFGIGGVLLSAIRTDLLWTLTSLLYTILICGTSRIRAGDEIQHSLFKWTPIPLSLGITGISPLIGEFWLLGDLAFVVLTPILGYMIILNFTQHTRFETNFYFSISFLFLFILSAGAVSGFIRFLSDRYISTSYLTTNYHIMIDFLVLILFGLLGILMFIFLSERNLIKDQNRYLIEDLKFEFKISVKYFKSHFFKILNVYFWSREDYSLLSTSRVLQFGILALTLYNIVIGNFWGYSIALISFILSIFPPLYSRYFKKEISPSFQFWIAITLFAYAAGETLRFQSRFGWWNEFTHFIAGIILGALILNYLFYLNEIFDNLHIPSKMTPIFVLTFILSISVLWEVFEFLIDDLLRTNLQGRFQDTVFDMIGNTIGAAFTILITDILTPFKLFRKTGRGDKKAYLNLDISSYLAELPILVILIVFLFIGLFFAILRSEFTWLIISSVFIALSFSISKFSKRD